MKKMFFVAAFLAGFVSFVNAATVTPYVGVDVGANYLKLTDQQKINLDIEKNIKLINEVEDNLFNKEDKAIKINQN